MKLAKRISLLLLTAMSTTRPVNCLTKGWTVSMKPRVTMFRLYKFWLALLALLFLLNTPQLAQAVDLTAWGPWRYAQTNTDYNPLEGGVAGVALSTGDEVAARFEISDVPSIEVAVFLKSDANFVPEQTTLKVQLRALGSGDVPGDVVTGTETELQIDPNEWTSYGWYSAVIEFPVAPSGTYWVCLYVEQTPGEGSLAMITERTDGLVYQLTWDPYNGRYVERDGLWYDGAQWTQNERDPYIRIRQQTGHLPVVIGITVDPNVATPGETVTLTATATDPDGADSIVSYRWTYMRNANPNKYSLAQGDVDPCDVVGDRIQITQTDTWEEGTYHIYFDVQDEQGNWSPFDRTFMPVIIDIPDPCLPSDPCLVSMGEIGDECGEDNLCIFVSQLRTQDVTDPDGNPTEIFNQYSVTVDAPPALVDHVYFRIIDPSSGEVVRKERHDSKSGNRYKVTFDMTSLPYPEGGNYTITATAHSWHDSTPVVCNCEDIEDDGECDPCNLPTEPSDPDYCCLFWLASTGPKTITILPAPAWYKKSVVDGPPYYVGNVAVIWDEEDRMYTFRGRVPYNPNLYYEKDYDIPYFGSRKNAGGLKVDVQEEYDLQATVEKSGEGGFDAWVLGVQVFNEPFDVVVEGDGADATYNVYYESLPLLDYSQRIYEGTLFRGAIDAVEFEINLSIDYGMEVSFLLCGVLPTNLKSKPACLQPKLNTSILFDASLDLYGGVVTFGLKGKPEFILGYPICHHYDYGRYIDLELEFIMKVSAYVCAGWGVACWETDEHDLVKPPWKKTVHDPCAPVNCFGSGKSSVSGEYPTTDGDPCGQATSEGPFASPRIASNGTGQALAVWIHDPCDNPHHPDVWYSYSPTPGTWTTPAPVDTTSGYFESDPRITFLEDQIRAILVVTQNQMAGEDLSTILSEQELVYYKFTPPMTWARVGEVHKDTGTPLADGRGTYGWSSTVPTLRHLGARIRRERGTALQHQCYGKATTTRPDVGRDGPSWRGWHHHGLLC